MPIDQAALFELTHGLYILGAKEPQTGRLVGSTIDAVAQVALKPLVLAVSCGTASYTGECIAQTGELSLSVLPKDADPFIVADFGFQTSRDKSVDKWKAVEYETDPATGLPVLKDALAAITAKVLQTVEFESHRMFLCEVTSAEKGKLGEPLTYNEYRAGFKDQVLEAWKKYKA